MIFLLGRRMVLLRPTALLIALLIHDIGAFKTFTAARPPCLHERQNQQQLATMARLPYSTCRQLSSRTLSLRGGTTVMVAGMALEPAVLRSSFEAVTELLTCCGLGVVATRVGLIDAAMTRGLARCVFNVFLPSMLSVSVARTVASGAGLSTLLPLPLCALVQVVLGLGIAVLLLGGPKQVRTPAGRDVAALASFGNSGVLPLVFANCLFRSAPELLARANSLVAMFLLGWSPSEHTRIPTRTPLAAATATLQLPLRCSYRCSAATAALQLPQLCSLLTAARSNPVPRSLLDPRVLAAHRPARQARRRRRRRIGGGGGAAFGEHEQGSQRGASQVSLTGSNHCPTY